MPSWVMLLEQANGTKPKPKGQVMKEFTKYVGLDVHKNTIEILTDDNRDGAVINTHACRL